MVERQQADTVTVQIPKRKLKWTEIKFTELLQRGKRLEGSYFNVEGKQARHAIEAAGYPVKPLAGEGGLAKEVFHRPRFKRIFVENGIPIFQSSQALELFPKPFKFVSDKTDTNLAQLYLQEGQILLTCSGSIGFASYVSRTLAGKLFSHDLIRIEAVSDIDRGYIYAFLRSRPGYLAVTTNTYGSVVTHVEPRHLQRVPIPNPPDKIKRPISEKILRAYELRDQANEALTKADSLLFSTLGWKRYADLTPQYLVKEHKAFTIRFHELNNRFEGSYHEPTIKPVLDEIRKSKVMLTTCGDEQVSKNIFLPGRFKRYYVDEEYGLPFLSGRNIIQIYPIGAKYLSASKHKGQMHELKLSENMILITRSGTIGRVVLAPRYYEDFTATEDIIRIVPSGKLHPGYIYAFLSSEYGSALIDRLTFGSVVDHIDVNQVASIPIPVPKDGALITKIGNLVFEANAKRDEAWRLEQQAIAEIEALIPM